MESMLLVSILWTQYSSATPTRTPVQHVLGLHVLQSQQHLSKPASQLQLIKVLALSIGKIQRCVCVRGGFFDRIRTGLWPRPLPHATTTTTIRNHLAASADCCCGTCSTSCATHLAPLYHCLQVALLAVTVNDIDLAGRCIQWGADAMAAEVCTSSSSRSGL